LRIFSRNKEKTPGILINVFRVFLTTFRVSQHTLEKKEPKNDILFHDPTLLSYNNYSQQVPQALPQLQQPLPQPWPQPPKLPLPKRQQHTTTTMIIQIHSLLLPIAPQPQPQPQVLFPQHTVKNLPEILIIFLYDLFGHSQIIYENLKEVVTMMA